MTSTSTKESTEIADSVEEPSAQSDQPSAQLEQPLAQSEQSSAPAKQPTAEAEESAATTELPASEQAAKNPEPVPAEQEQAGESLGNAQQVPPTEAAAQDTPPAEPTEEPQTAASDSAQQSSAASPAEITADAEASSPDGAAATDNEIPKQQPKPIPDISVADELDKLVADLATIGHKNTAKLVTVDNLLNRFRKFIDQEEAALLAKAESIRESLNSKFAENATHQLSLQKATDELLDKLESALAEGQSIDALPTWDRIQGNISNTNGEIRQLLQARANPFKPKILELRDWKIFAATEKKKELIQQMEHLCESKMHAADRSKHITRLHKEWKELGRSNQNEELWQQFKQFSDRAYEPCAEHFKQRKQQMAANLKARRELCDQLEQQIEAITKDEEGELKVTALNKLIKDAEEDWKKHAPVEQSRIRSLQKRFYNNINVLRKKRKAILKANATAKRVLIEQANGLAELEDRNQAMSEAKRLQKEWKEIGPTSFKEDKEHWDNFRAACDKLFDSRKDSKRGERPQRTAARQGNDKEIQGKLTALEKILELSEDELRNSRGEYQDLAQGFSSALDGLDKRQRSKFLDKFNAIKRKVDNRLKALPDKKTLALMEQLQPAIAYLQNLEPGLLAAESANFEAEQQKFTKDDWQSLDKVKSDPLLALLESRASAILDSGNPTDYARHVTEATEVAREICIQVEIRAGNDSPEADQAKRMQIQLGQLQKGLGQARHTSKENMQFIQEARLQLICLGPLHDADRDAFRQRVEDSSKRLL